MTAYTEQHPRHGVELSFRQRHAIRSAMCERAKRCGCTERDRKHAESAAVAVAREGRSIATAVQAGWRYLRGSRSAHGFGDCA